MKTKYNIEVSNAMFINKLNVLVNQFYKILPIKESGEPSITQYLNGLLREMLGLKSLIQALDNDAMYMSLLSILQYLIDNDCDVATVKSDVFKSINILKKMISRFEKKTEG